MSLGQQITYNGFTFPFNKLDVSSAVVYAEDHISVIGTQYIFSVSGVIQAAQADSADQTSLDQMMRNMRDFVLQPGGEFKVQWGTTTGASTPGVSNLTAPYYTPYHIYGGRSTNNNSGNGVGSATGYGHDIDWGPKPGNLVFTKFSGGLAALYTWSLTVMVKECWSPTCAITGLNTGILAITTHYQHSIDSDGLCQRTLSGKLTVTGTSVVVGKNADSYRFQITPPIPTNFRRVSQSFDQSEDGRELSFSIVDQEMIYTLPTPLTDGQATWSIELFDLGCKVNYTLSGWFSAASSQDKSIILNKIADLVQDKFPIGDPGLIFKGRTLSESIYDRNRIDFSISAEGNAGVAPGSNSIVNFAVGLTTLTKSPPNTTGQSRVVYPDGGDAESPQGIFAPAPVPWDACSANNPLQSIGKAAQGVVLNDNTAPPTPAEGVIASANQIKPNWMAYSETISYEIKNNIAMFYPKKQGARPIAQQTNNPVVSVIQCGYASKAATRASDGPTAPMPFQINTAGSSKFVVTDSFVQPSVPEPIGDGTKNRYSIQWRYVLRQIQTPTTLFAEIEPRYPVDQRRPDIDPASAAYAFPNNILPAEAYVAKLS